MEHKFYLPIYSWNDNSVDGMSGTSFGTTIYSNLQDLYGFNYDHTNKVSMVVGYFELKGNIPTKEEFEKQEKNSALDELTQETEKLGIEFK